jgi:peroxiredoxin
VRWPSYINSLVLSNRKEAYIDVVRMALLTICLVVVLPVPAQETGDALRILESSAHKYGEIGSYESSAVARRPRGDGLTLQVGLKFAYASAAMTPPDLPVPMLPQVIQMGPFEVLDQHKSPTKYNYSFTGPGPAFSFDQVAWRVTSAKIMGSETVNSHPCKIVEVQYEGTRRNPKGEPVRYWIDSETKTIWKMQFSEPDALSKNGDLARWTVVWDSWNEDHAPPAWLLDAGKSMAGAETTALIGHAAPEVDGRSLGGESFRLSKLKGAVVVLDFWATWCGPCVEEMASLEGLKASLPDRAVEFWSITEDNPEAVRRWLEERKRTLPTVTIPRDTAFRSYGVESLPQVAIIDRKGVVAHQWAGLKSEKDLRQAIELIAVQ